MSGQLPDLGLCSPAMTGSDTREQAETQKSQRPGFGNGSGFGEGDRIYSQRHIIELKRVR